MCCCSMPCVQWYTPSPLTHQPQHDAWVVAACVVFKCTPSCYSPNPARWVKSKTELRRVLCCVQPYTLLLLTHPPQHDVGWRQVSVHNLLHPVQVVQGEGDRDEHLRQMRVQGSGFRAAVDISFSLLQSRWRRKECCEDRPLAK